MILLIDTNIIMGKARLPTAAEGDGRLERLERSAVMLSFWVGGLGLVLMKYVAYSLSQSTLVRASMFESVGDVLSSTIMAVTRSKVADSRDSHNYPTGKRRLTPLGILFFAAFATSTFANLAMESVQKLVMAEPAPSAGCLARGPVGGPATRQARQAGQARQARQA